MRASFIGMSNIGKTYWSKRIAAENGYGRIDCDTQIEKKLSAELAQGNYRGMRGVARWMGLPSAPHYQKNSRRYIECEQMVMEETLLHLKSHPQLPLIVDTTGSVIYTSDTILAELGAHTHIIYLEASEEHINDLFKRYIANPKPVIWGDSYTPEPGEAPSETLKRCYPELLRQRIQRYRDIAHVTIPFDQHRDRRDDLGPRIKQQIGGV